MLSSTVSQSELPDSITGLSEIDKYADCPFRAESYMVCPYRTGIQSGHEQAGPYAPDENFTSENRQVLS